MKRKDYTEEMKRIVTEKSCRLLGTYGCTGFDTFGPFKLVDGIAKGHPDDNDVNGAIEFYMRIIKQ